MSKDSLSVMCSRYVLPCVCVVKVTYRYVTFRTEELKSERESREKTVREQCGQYHSLAGLLTISQLFR